MAYTDQSDYAKFLKKKCEENEESCWCNKKNEDCGCCPPGLVAVEDATNNNVACLDPNDAELYYKNIFKCPDGFIKALDGTGNFVGCLNIDDYTAFVATLTP